MPADSTLVLGSLPGMAQRWPSAGGRQDQAHQGPENDGWVHTCQRAVEGNTTGNAGAWVGWKSRRASWRRWHWCVGRSGQEGTKALGGTLLSAGGRRTALFPRSIKNTRSLEPHVPRPGVAVLIAGGVGGSTLLFISGDGVQPACGAPGDSLRTLAAPIGVWPGRRMGLRYLHEPWIPWWGPAAVPTPRP